jgi:hypothetical protein
MTPINDTSRALRYELVSLCERYNRMVADKDTIDFRLGSPQPYDATAASVNPEREYEHESYVVSDDLRRVIVEMIEIGQRIREIERF